jgi:hypothetical protein
MRGKLTRSSEKGKKSMTPTPLERPIVFPVAISSNKCEASKDKAMPNVASDDPKIFQGTKNREKRIAKPSVWVIPRAEPEDHYKEGNLGNNRYREGWAK